MRERGGKAVIGWTYRVVEGVIGARVDVNLYVAALFKRRGDRVARGGRDEAVELSEVQRHRAAHRACLVEPLFDSHPVVADCRLDVASRSRQMGEHPAQAKAARADLAIA